MTLHRFLVGSLCASLALVGCAPDPDAEDPFGPDQGPPPPDACNTQGDAVGVAECALTLGTARSEYIGLPSDVDWFSVRLPTTLSGRSLMHLSAGYAINATSVNLSVNLMNEAGKSLGTAIDHHGQAAPKLLDLILRGAEPGARLLLMVSDELGGAHYDWRNPYALKFEVVDDPDGNEPNDTTPTVIPMAADGARLVGTQSGYLATPDDVDRFSFTLPAGRKILHLRISGPKVDPAPNFRLSYRLLDASGTPVAEDHMANEFLPLELATARTTTGGNYVLEVKGYKWEVVQVVPGDLRQKYTVDVQSLDELDANEPNNTLETAKAQTLSAPGQGATLRGRIGQVPDPDWFAFDLPAASQPTVLHYKLTPGTAAGRFPVLPGPLDRQVRIFTEVKTGATLADRQANCKKTASVCPRREDAPGDQLALVDTYCAASPPRCMWSAREENPKFVGLKNFEGAVAVAPHTGTVRYFVVLEDEGNNWADDKEYTLSVTWRDDPDEASRFSGSGEQTSSRSIMVDGAASGFPSPPAGSELTGTLSYGYGYWRNNDPLKGEGLRAVDDYDSVSSDTDRYELVFPAGLSAPLDRTWELQWEVDKEPGGRAPYDIALEVEFCDGTKSTTSCSTVSRTLGYKGGDLGAWHSAGQQGVTFQPVYSLEQLSDRTRVTGLAWGCFCFEPRFIQGGRFFVKVVAVDRESYADVSYRVRTALTSYPKAYNGGSCPAPVQAADGTWGAGCKFTQ